MTVDMMIYTIPHQPLPLPVPFNEDDLDMLDFDPLPLDASFSSGDLGFLCDIFPSTHGTADDSSLATTHTNNNYSNNKKTYHHRRHVSFQDQEPSKIITVPCFANLAEEERRDLWYRQVEIESFRSVARHACRRLRKDPDAYPADITRGLELRTSLDRQYRKHLARTCILKSQIRYPHIDPLHLAAIANRCTELPRQEALAQGARDYCEVYYPNNNNMDNNDNDSASFRTTNTGEPIPTTEVNVDDTPFHQSFSNSHHPINSNKRLPSMIFCESYVNTVANKRRFISTNDFHHRTLIEQTNC
jgi:hypothetical protein